MGGHVVLRHDEWTAIPHTGTGALLTTAAKRAVSHTVGANVYPVVLRQLASDPAHPFTDGRMEIRLQSESTLLGVRDVGHSANFDHGLFYDRTQEAPGSHLKGGFHMAGYRVPLEWLIQIYTQVTPTPQKQFLQINCVRPDEGEIDADDQTAASITIDPDIDATATDIALSNGTSTPSVNGGVQMRWELTEAQHTTLKAVDGDGNPDRKTLGITIAAASAVEPVTYSAFAETHPDIDEGEYYLRFRQTVGLQAPATGGWYGRATNPNGSTIYVGD